MGFHVGSAIGMRLHKYFRADVELSYRRTEVDDLDAQREVSHGQGYFSMLSAMANGYVDYDFGLPVIPYVGAGIGWARVELDANNEDGILRVEGEDNILSWALMIGGSIPVNDVMDISVGYRYIKTMDTQLESALIRTTTGEASERLDSEFDSHEGVVTVRYRF